MIFKLHHVFEVFLCVSVCVCLVAAFQDDLESTINKAVNNIRRFNDNHLSGELNSFLTNHDENLPMQYTGIFFTCKN